MAFTLRLSARTAMAAGIVSDAGSACRWRFYNGTKPASLGAVTSQTLLATLTHSSTLGTTASGAISIDVAGQSNTAGSNVSGTPTWARLETSGGTAVMDADCRVPADPADSTKITVSAAVVSGTAFTMAASTLTMPNAA
jgi:hypothetical protein